MTHDLYDEDTATTTEQPDSLPAQPRDGMRERLLTIPTPSLVVLIGPSGSGKSTFAARHFAPTETLSSDAYRAIVGDDANDQTVTAAAFAALRAVAAIRLRLGRLTVVDATSVKPRDRAALVHVAREHDVPVVAIVLNLDERTCLQRNAVRMDRQFGAHVVRTHIQLLRRGLQGLEREGFRPVSILNTPAEVDAVRVARIPLPTDRRDDAGPFDIIGDLHGCAGELAELLALLGYQPDPAAGYRHPGGRRAIFLGDLVDRGPRVVETVTLVRRMVAGGAALCLPGNHDDKLLRYLRGRPVHIAHGLAESIAQINALPPDARASWVRDYRDFVDALPSHYLLAGGDLVVAHAGMKEAYQGRDSPRVRAFALYGQTTGESDELGLPIRGDWAADYRGRAAVVYGHTAVYAPAWRNNTIDIDTGCVYGGRLTALRWPERELVGVPAHATYAEPKRPLAPPSVDDEAGNEDPADTLLRIEDALG